MNTDKTNNGLAVVILAAGKGTRMKSDLPKVLHTLGGKPLLTYSIEVANELKANPIVVVVGHQAEKVEKVYEGYRDLRMVLQFPQMGTGHAVMCASEALAGHLGNCLVLCGDVPGIKSKTLKKMLDIHVSSDFDLTVLGMKLKEPAHYGRLITDDEKTLNAIVEYRDATEQQKAVNLVNAGIYLFRTQNLLKYLPFLTTENDQKEYYLTDLAKIMNDNGLKVGYALCDDPQEVSGVNSREELKALELKLYPNVD